MVNDHILATLRLHQAELTAASIVGLAVFGSVARVEDQPDSDVDVVVRLSEDAQRGGVAYSAGLPPFPSA